MDRSKQIIRTSVIGIIANVLLAAFKAFVGILASSVAIVLDAVNNLSDALSSVITIAGTKLSLKPADNTHPFASLWDVEHCLECGFGCAVAVVEQRIVGAVGYGVAVLP